MASAACIKTASADSGHSSSWWAAIAFTTSADSRYFFAKSAPIVTCGPSTSWSIALPISCNNPINSAKSVSSSFKFNSSANSLLFCVTRKICDIFKAIFLQIVVQLIFDAFYLSILVSHTK